MWRTALVCWGSKCWHGRATINASERARKPCEWNTSWGQPVHTKRSGPSLWGLSHWPASFASTEFNFPADVVAQESLNAKMLKYGIVSLLREPCKNLHSLHHLRPSLPPHLLLFHLHFITFRSPLLAVLCPSPAGMCASPMEVIPFLLQSLNYIPCPGFFFFSTQLLRYITVIYTVRTTILHHPACRILCSLLFPRSCHLSVPSGTRSFYQWYGASASSSEKSRSRWEGWCWKDSRQRRQNIATFRLWCCRDGALFSTCHTPFKHPSVLWLALNPSKKKI